MDWLLNVKSSIPARKKSNSKKLLDRERISRRILSGSLLDDHCSQSITTGPLSSPPVSALTMVGEDLYWGYSCLLGYPNSDASSHYCTGIAFDAKFITRDRQSGRCQVSH
ncbi:hypothetical protein SAMN06265222_109160 [Neorhodopirellula lusitana]|uniref:Uncharacterized protein n=1 Tax=Neorhodopirellula lusitana TaxID=445327 RepID=A0ABY1QAX4_9BACT|nr:hypothetical protein SAMN06265222_109160 [Neorhodopirellula lusitana]